MSRLLAGALGALLLTGAAPEGFSRPAAVRWGASLDETRAALAGECRVMTVRRIDPPFLDVVRDRQMQIDCEGLVFRGRPRHAEFVIGDDRLGMV
jgi:hypothetical protein